MRVWYSVHEVFYNKAGKPWGMTQDPVGPEGESVAELLHDLKLMKRDLEHLPVLDARKVRWSNAPRDIQLARKNPKKIRGIRLEDIDWSDGKNT